MTPKDFGKWLRQQRENKNIPLEEIAAVTKVHISNLRNIEEGNAEALPQPAFVRGFIISYAQCIGLAEEEVLPKYREAYNVTPLTKDNLKIKPSVATNDGEESTTQRMTAYAKAHIGPAPASRNLEKEDLTFFTTKRVLIGVGTILFLGTLVWLVNLGKAKKTQPPSTPAVSDQATESPSAQTSSADQTTAQADPSQKTSSEEKTPPPTKKHNVTLVANESTWVRIFVDGQPGRWLQIEANKTLPIDYERTLLVSLTNSGAIEYKINGKHYGPYGFRGDVKRLTFPKDIELLTIKAPQRPAPTTPAPAAAPATNE